ncbi:MAG: peptidase U32 family protein [Candidatus Woesearchaeota archaeon]|jgi:putative protease|nr:peptidase U32 family protein [Candidatus Woesearchaeota archaeon]MDP6266007.1 peptidase U32 family protein [Candidatus Woesearchaeota archaeon]MDP7322823.1 peptidase U32 family protein [Candidatus Woesearchaeota archaeon]MDP7476550.1 peptidase U32 family protein [Candidatus Woesearchaeota archaeon]HJO01502.1 peptidase U32 family protein [Candidatus Woesearchaeota archaeon]|tara:strand:+ start:125 stop:1366 length:1242 start_codon:yes stop_codon:yes gene_type:complete
MSNVEIMAPAGSFEALQAATKAGADSVYFGVGKLNMRARSANFKFKDLEKVAAICKKNNVKSYLALNTILYDSDMSIMKRVCNRAKKSGVNAVIVSDIAAMMYAKYIGLEAHSSTQLNISNIEAVKFFSEFTDVIIPARELTLKQIESIVKQIKKEKIKGPSGKPVKIELFCHGALCVSIAGKCYMSLATYNASANRGACLQNCRRSYKVIEEGTGNELVIDNKYVMSPKDLCTIGFLDKIVKAGVSVLKIEGRARSPEYVYEVTKAYKEAIESINRNNYTKDKIKGWTKKLKGVYNRGFWDNGYYLGKKLGQWSGTSGSKATTKKQYIGKVFNYFNKPQVAEIILEAGKLKQSDSLLITGPTTGVVQTKAETILKDDKKVREAKKKDHVTVKVSEKARKNDKVYVIKPVANA